MTIMPIFVVFFSLNQPTCDKQKQKSLGEILNPTQIRLALPEKVALYKENKNKDP